MNESKELLLIGTVHTDPDGASRLRNLLQRENPSIVLVEASPYGLAFRQRNNRRLRRLLARRMGSISRAHGVSSKEAGAVQGLFTQILMPYEYSSSLRFCRDSGARIHCIDLSSESKRLIGEQWNEMLAVENLKALWRVELEDSRSTVRRSYGLASRLLAEKEKSCINPYVREWLEDPAWQKREAHLAEQIRLRFERMTTGRLAYVGGWQHLLYPTDAHTLCDRLARLKPRRVLLS
jgi:hypothetical protein